MQIDWVTVAAQIVNFLILVWLLKRFLYGPVVRAMRQREQHIGQRLQQAEEREKNAQEKADAYEEKERELENKRDELMGKAREEAEAYRQELREEIESEMANERRRLREQVARERDDFLRDLRRHVGQEFEALARSALGDLADQSLEAQVAEAFAKRVQDMDADERRRIAEAALREAGELKVTSAYELPADARRRITRVLHDGFDESLDVTYGRNPDLTCGVELQAAGHSVLWSLDSYLDDFAERLSGKLDEMAVARQPEAA